MRQNRVHVRLLMVAGVALLWTTAVFGRLSYLQLFAHGEYLARAQRQQQRTIEITPKRGIIYDRNMHALAMSVPVKSAFAVPAEIADESMASGLLSGVLGVPQDVLEARMASSRSFVWISRKLPPVSRTLCWLNWKPEPSKSSVRSIQNNSSSSSARICRKGYSPTPGMAETEIRLVGDYLDILVFGWKTVQKKISARSRSTREE